jgi:hypothetical protein
MVISTHGADSIAPFTSLEFLEALPVTSTGVNVIGTSSQIDLCRIGSKLYLLKVLCCHLIWNTGTMLLYVLETILCLYLVEIKNFNRFLQLSLDQLLFFSLNPIFQRAILIFSTLTYA